MSVKEYVIFSVDFLLIEIQFVGYVGQLMILMSKFCSNP